MECVNSLQVLVGAESQVSVKWLAGLWLPREVPSDVLLSRIRLLISIGL